MQMQMKLWLFLRVEIEVAKVTIFSFYWKNQNGIVFTASSFQFWYVLVPFSSDNIFDRR